MLSPRTTRRIWLALGGICVAETVGMFALAPFWNGGAIVGEIHSLALLVAGAAVFFFLLATTQPGASLNTRLNRFLFAALGGTAFNVIATWALWAIGYPIDNGAVRRGLMAENYWLGPAVLAYATVVWLVYRRGLAKERKQ